MIFEITLNQHNYLHDCILYHGFNVRGFMCNMDFFLSLFDTLSYKFMKTVTSVNDFFFKVIFFNDFPSIVN